MPGATTVNNTNRTAPSSMLHNMWLSPSQRNHPMAISDLQIERDKLIGCDLSSFFPSFKESRKKSRLKNTALQLLGTTAGLLLPSYPLLHLHEYLAAGRSKAVIGL